MENQLSPELDEPSKSCKKKIDEDLDEATIVELKKICNLSNPLEKYELSKKLGLGSGGFAFLATNLETKQIFAIKKTEMKKVRSEKMILNEIQQLQALNHVNLVEFVEVFYQEDPHLGDLLWTVMEYMEG